MISLTPAPPRSGFRYVLSGRISKNAQWTQVLEIPADGSLPDISGSVVRLTLREKVGDSPEVSIFSPAEITISDDDTLAINVAPSVLSSLCDGKTYLADLTSVASSVITHWAHGSVFVVGDPPGY